MVKKKKKILKEKERRKVDILDNQPLENNLSFLGSQ